MDVKVHSGFTELTEALINILIWVVGVDVRSRILRAGDKTVRIQVRNYSTIV